jgi:hypothetical protein
MKILIIPIFYFLFTFSNQVSITVIDEKTDEKLVGVIENNSQNFTDFDGQLKSEKGEILKLKLVSYQDVVIENIKNDTIIKMKQN